jgi:hypothetical protein
MFDMTTLYFQINCSTYSARHQEVANIMIFTISFLINEQV